MACARLAHCLMYGRIATSLIREIGGGSELSANEAISAVLRDVGLKPSYPWAVSHLLAHRICRLAAVQETFAGKYPRPMRPANRFLRGNVYLTVITERVHISGLC